MIEYAQQICMQAELFFVIGTSKRCTLRLFSLILFQTKLNHLIDKIHPVISFKNIKLLLKSSTKGVSE
jgi:hypothetical protein